MWPFKKKKLEFSGDVVAKLQALEAETASIRKILGIRESPESAKNPYCDGGAIPRLLDAVKLMQHQLAKIPKV